MKKIILENVRLVVLAGILSLGVGVAFAAWTPAPANAPDNNAPAPINVGSANQVKNGGLSLNSLVVGTVKILDGVPGAGKVLTSDADGLASWQNPSAGGQTPVGSAVYECTIQGVKVLSITSGGSCGTTPVGHLMQ